MLTVVRSFGTVSDRGTVVCLHLVMRVDVPDYIAGLASLIRADT